MTEHAFRHRWYGLVYLLILALLVGLCFAMYAKVFTPVATVRLRVADAGLQLFTGSDVKRHGVNIGEVRAIESDGRVATLTLALEPEQLATVPANTEARLIPKTVFGEKYVALRDPARPAGGPLRAGDTISADRATNTVESTQLLTDLRPTLTALDPPRLNAALTALATGLEGRGQRLGDNMVRLDGYLRRLNPKLPVLQRDLAALADVAHAVDAAAPDLARTLANTTVTSATITAERASLRSFLDSVTGGADAMRATLDRTGDDLVRVNAVNRQLLAALARYSPVYRCVFAGALRLQPRIAAALGGPDHPHQVRVTVEAVKPRGPYRPGLDAPQLVEDRGPDCYGLPNPRVPMPGMAFADGTQDDPRFSPAARDRLAVNAVAALATGQHPGRVPDVATLLYGPLVRGTEVTVR